MITKLTVVRTFLFIFLSCVVVTGFAQKNFKPGYVVTNAGDTVRGQIDDLAWDINPVSILFKKASDERWYAIPDIRSFGFSNTEVYIRAIVSYHEIPLDITKEEPGDGQVVKTDTVFLRSIVEGKNSLYELVTLQRPYFFISDNGEPIELLAGVKKTIEGKFIRDNTYMNTLYFIATKQGKGEALKSKIESASYSSSGIGKVISLMNGGAMPVVAKNKGSLFEIGGGLALTRFSMSQGASVGNLTDYNIINGASIKSSIAPDVEAAVVFGSERGSNQIRIRFSIGFSMFTFKGDGDPSKAIGTIITKESYYGKVKLLRPGLGVMLIANPFGKNKFYLNPGFGIWMTVGSSTITRTSVDPFWGTNKHADYPVVNKVSSAMNLGIGMLTNRSKLELKGDYSDNISAVGFTNASVIRLTLGYYYTLNKF